VESNESRDGSAARGRINRRELLARGAATAATVATSGGLLAACGSGSGVSGGGGRKNTVVLMAPMDPSLNEINKYLLPQFTRETGIKVELLQSDYNSLLQKLVRDAQNNTGAYDLEIINDVWIPSLAGPGLVHDLAELGVKPDADMFDGIVAESYWPRAAKPVPPSAKGKKPAYVSQCLVADVAAFVYRKDLVGTPPATWDDVLAAAKAHSDPSKQLYGYVFPGSQANGDPSWWLNHFYAYGGRVVDDQWNPAVNSPEGVRALDLLLALEKTASPGVAQFGFDQFGQALNNGQTVSAVSFTGWIKDVFNPAKSKVADKMAVTAIPAGTTHASCAGPIMTAIPRSAKNPEGAAKLLNWLTSHRIQQKYASDYGGIAMRPSVLADPKLAAKYPYFPGVHDSLQIARAFPPTDLFLAVYTVLVQQLNLAYTQHGKNGSKSYLDAAAKGMRRIFQQGGYYS
jgi:multiple sugar transport system substrate-binding protein